MSARVRVAAQVAAVVLVLAAGAAGVWLVFENAPRPAPREHGDSVPLVRAMAVRAEDVQLDVRSHGTVTAPLQVRLVAEVPGRVRWVAPELVAGGFLQEGQEVVRIDPRDYELAATQARAEVAHAETRLALERAEAEAAAAEWRELGLEEQPSPLVLREPQVAEARAALAAARAALEKAKLDLERTVLRAPFTARVRTESIDPGQFVARGEVLAALYGVEQAEVRLPVPDHELAWLDLPPPGAPERGADGPEVLLTAEFGGAARRWQGRVVRSEGEIDARTRMVHLVAVVDDPLGRATEESGPAMVPGLFVEASISGRTAEDAVVVPRHALRADDTVLVVEDGRLRIREVEVLRRERDRAVLRGGLRPGEQLVVSPLEVATDGMRVRVESPGEPSVAGGR